MLYSLHVLVLLVFLGNSTKIDFSQSSRIVEYLDIFLDCWIIKVFEVFRCIYSRRFTAETMIRDPFSDFIFIGSGLESLKSLSIYLSCVLSLGLSILSFISLVIVLVFFDQLIFNFYFRMFYLYVVCGAYRSYHIIFLAILP